MKKQFMALIMSLTVALSGAAGFSGTYIANLLSDNSDTASDETDLFDGIDKDKLNEYIDGYLGSSSSSGTSSDSSASGGSTSDNSASDDSSSNDSSSNDVSLVSSSSASGVLTIPEIAAANSKSVVEIYTETVTGGGRMGQYVSEGAGSGVIISKDGYIVTNNHVIEDSRKITVRLENGDDYEAELIGRDSKTDIAVIKINASDLQPAVFGNSDNLVVGELAVAIGNPLGELGGSVTDGIISALSRKVEIDGNMMTLLQISTAVNPGNSGGGLFNQYGELIGIVNAKSSGSDIEGIGFAIPINLARSVAEDLIKYGYIPGRVDLGAEFIDILDSMTAMMYRVSTTGVYVSQADSDSGLRAGDLVTHVNGTEINSSADIDDLLDSYEAGDVLSFKIVRSGESQTVYLELKQALN